MVLFLQWKLSPTILYLKPYNRHSFDKINKVRKRITKYKIASFNHQCYNDKSNYNVHGQNLFLNELILLKKYENSNNNRQMQLNLIVETLTYKGRKENSKAISLEDLEIGQALTR